MICKHCGQEIVYGIPEPTPIEIKYKKFHPYPTYEFWYHVETRNSACSLTQAEPISETESPEFCAVHGFNTHHCLSSEKDEDGTCKVTYDAIAKGR